MGIFWKLSMSTTTKVKICFELKIQADAVLFSATNPFLFLWHMIFCLRIKSYVSRLTSYWKRETKSQKLNCNFLMSCFVKTFFYNLRNVFNQLCLIKIIPITLATSKGFALWLFTLANYVSGSGSRYIWMGQPLFILRRSLLEIL